MEYYLKKEGNSGEFDYIDQDGISWDSPAQWLWGFLGGCGCGSSEYFGERALELLTYFSKPHSERKETDVDPYENLEDELLAHWLDKEGFLEHGTSVCGSWLSEKGEKIYNAILSAKEIGK